MARVLFQTLTLSRFSLSLSAKAPPSVGVVALRHHSDRSGKSQLIEINIESDSGDVEVMGIRRLEDAIHRIIVQRLAPDWLPFIPGSSYWVPPPRRPYNILQYLGKLSGEISMEEALTITSVRGWPSASFFIRDGASKHPYKAKKGVAEVELEGESELDVKVQTESENTSTSQSEDEEG